MIDKYVFYSDPGHGWLAVELAELAELGIAHRISRYSYLKQGIVFLEEDMDMGTFIRAKEKLGQPVEIIDDRGQCLVRGYSPYYVSPFEVAQ